MLPPITQPGPDPRGRLETTAWGDDARAQREARAREAQLQAARLAEARRAAEELDRWALARAYRWAADQALLGRAHLQDPAHDPLDIRYTENWPGLEGVAGPRLPAIPPTATRDEFRPWGGVNPRRGGFSWGRGQASSAMMNGVNPRTLLPLSSNPLREPRPQP